MYLWSDLLKKRYSFTMNVSEQTEREVSTIQQPHHWLMPVRNDVKLFSFDFRLSPLTSPALPKLRTISFSAYQITYLLSASIYRFLPVLSFIKSHHAISCHIFAPNSPCFVLLERYFSCLVHAEHRFYHLVPFPQPTSLSLAYRNPELVVLSWVQFPLAVWRLFSFKALVAVNFS